MKRYLIPHCPHYLKLLPDMWGNPKGWASLHLTFHVTAIMQVRSANVKGNRRSTSSLKPAWSSISENHEQKVSVLKHYGLWWFDMQQDCIETSANWKSPKSCHRNWVNWVLFIRCMLRCNVNKESTITESHRNLTL